ISLLSQEADRENLDKDELIVKRIENAGKKIKANALIARRLAELHISEDDLFNYYRIHLGEFQKPIIEYKLQRIFIKDYNRVERVLTEIRAGLDFSSAVSIFSQEALRESGGYMGFVSSSGADSIFWNVAKDLGRGEAGIVTHQDGWFIIRHYEERSASAEAGFDMYKDEIRRRIVQERKQQVFDDLLLELKQKNSEIYYY
ncbi:MAG: peptidylprolyl isomerase, partial [Candidatus Cloacimonadaceae bacterium]|nr:peptidylprolyl isomerase [Candidatus Cloacimonadaceae bacterium]